MVFCLDIFANLLMDCNLIAPMDANGDVGSGFAIYYIKYSAALVDASLLDTRGILLFSGRDSTVSAMHSDLVLPTYTVWHMNCSMDGPKYHISTPYGYQDCFDLDYFVL